MAITIKDIAKKVGVNPSTVSRVINGNASISEETKKKIFQAMEELNYHPNILGRSLVNGSTSTIGLIIDTENPDAFSNTFFIQSIAAMEVIAEKNGYNLLITSARRNQNRVKDLVLGHKIDGLILPSENLTSELKELFLNESFPFIIMGETEYSDPNVVWTDMDNEQGSGLAVSHLLDQGYSHPVLLVENKTDMFERKRIQGFQQKMEEKGIVFTAANIIECGSSKESILNNIHCLLRENVAWDSIICTNNVVAYHTMTLLKEHGIRIPEDIGIITFDNYPLAQYMEPALTAIDIDTYCLGEWAAKMLIEKIRDNTKTYKNKLISTHIIQRNSTLKQKEELLDQRSGISY